MMVRTDWQQYDLADAMQQLSGLTLFYYDQAAKAPKMQLAISLLVHGMLKLAQFETVLETAHSLHLIPGIRGIKRIDEEYCTFPAICLERESISTFARSQSRCDLDKYSLLVKNTTDDIHNVFCILADLEEAYLSDITSYPQYIPAPFSVSAVPLETQIVYQEEPLAMAGA